MSEVVGGSGFRRPMDGRKQGARDQINYTPWCIVFFWKGAGFQ